MKTIVLALSLGLVTVCCGADTRTATCSMAVNSATPDIADQVTGEVNFSQEDEGSVTVTVSLTGFSTSDSNTLHGFHVHETGVISGGCSNTGGHYNPEGKDHGAPTAAVRHVGDLGNIAEGSNGAVSTTIVDDQISLTGDHSIIGLAIVVHENADDLGLGGDAGSLSTGNAGSRLACCVITETSNAAAITRMDFGLMISLLLVGFFFKSDA